MPQRIGLIKKTYLLCLFLLLSLINAPNLFALTAKAALIMDADSGKVYFHRNMNKRLPTASTIKVFSSVLIMNHLKLSDKVKVTHRAAGIEPSKLYLKEGTVYTAGDLLRGFLMCSANDAGVSLAEAVSPTEFRFSLLMNKTAQEWGAKRSFFLNATGLPEYGRRQYSTAYDLALFMRRFLNYKKLVRILGTKYAEIRGSDGKTIVLKNHNKFLWKNSNDLVGKTGYTCAAKHCFLGFFTRGQKRLIVVILGSKKPWQDLNYLIHRKV